MNARNPLRGFTVAIALWFLFPDSPVDARFLTAEEKVLAVKRVAESKTGVKNKEFKMYQASSFSETIRFPFSSSMMQIHQALLDPKTWLLVVASIAAQIPNGYHFRRMSVMEVLNADRSCRIVSNFSTIIIKVRFPSVVQAMVLMKAARRDLVLQLFKVYSWTPLLQESKSPVCWLQGRWMASVRV